MSIDLDQLLLKWRETEFTPDELAALKEALNTSEGRAQLRATFEMDVALREALTAQQAVARSQKQAEEFSSAPRRSTTSWWLPWIGPDWQPVRLQGALIIGVLVGLLAGLGIAFARPAFSKPVPPQLAAGTGIIVMRGNTALSFSRGLVLEPGDRLKTSSNGWGVVTDEAAGIYFELGKATDLQVPASRSSGSWELRRGEVQAAVAPRLPGQPMRVLTPGAKLDILGTKLALWADSTFTRLDVEQGLVKLHTRRTGQAVEVSSDYYAEVIEGKSIAVHFGANVNRLADLVKGQTVLDDTDSSCIRYSPGWVLRRHGRFNNTTHETCKAGEWAEISFTGTGFALTGEKMPYGGTAELFVNGQSRGIISYQAPPPGFTRRMIFSVDGLAAGRHTIKIVGRGDGWIYVDSFRFTP